ncbi:MAG: GIY-YIG nuclease family protein [Verrucomicrobiae bacterium]
MTGSGTSLSPAAASQRSRGREATTPRAILYTGITSDVQRRLKVHNAGKGSAYVRAHRPAKPVAFTAEESRSTASRLEYSVKSLSRSEKVSLAQNWKSRSPEVA